MFKYIAKRLGISIIVLFGVSVILYSLVRMMPVDYITQKFQSQLSQGTMTMDDIDNYKKLYGLYNPEAEIRFEITDESNTEEARNFGVFATDVRIDDYNKYSLTPETYLDLICPSSSGDSKTKNYSSSFDGVTKYKLDLISSNNDGIIDYTYKLFEVTFEIKEEERTDDTGEKYIVEIKKEIDTLIDTGTFNAAINSLTNSPEVTFTSSKGLKLKTITSYYTFNFFQRFGNILGGYFNWLGKLMTGDLGTSWKYERPVAEVISDYMWISFAIAIVATILQFLIAIPLGITSSTHQYSARDYIVTILTMIGISLPTYFFAAILIKVFAVNLGWFPTSGLNSSKFFDTSTFVGWLDYFGDTVHHLVLPIFCSVILSLGGLMRYTRTNMLEVLSADYIRTARAKGLSEKRVIYKHAFRNTMIPLVTLLAGTIPSLFGGMMITEQVFGIPGIGNKAYNALMAGDIPFVMGYNMFLAILSVLGTLLSDLMYSVVDPRVKIGK